MGTWGATAFENDSALDWVGGRITLKTIRNALAVIGEASTDAYLDADDCGCALAAAECIAAARGHAVRTFPDGARTSLAAVRRGLAPADVKEAKAIVERVRKHSELSELWGKSKEWKAACADLSRRLAQRPVALPRAVPTKKMVPRVGDVLLVPLDDGSRGIVKIVSVTAQPPTSVRIGVYPMRLAAGDDPPAPIDAPFAELLHGMVLVGGPKGWPLVRNEPVLAKEILAIAKTATTQPDRERALLPRRHLEQLARGLRVTTHADGTAMVTFTPELERAFELSTPLPGWLAKLVRDIVLYAEANRTRSA